jgi:predicted exporter
MGVDYGIFLVEHAHEQAHTWMTICLSAISTVLSLGLLMFSSTPALHVLGLSLGVGMASAWLIAAIMGRYVYQQQRS